MADSKCAYCSMEIRKSGKMAWWEGAEYGEYPKTATIQSGYADCEHFELWIENQDKWTDETEVCVIPITHCPWCGKEL